MLSSALRAVKYVRLDGARRGAIEPLPAELAAILGRNGAMTTTSPTIYYIIGAIVLVAIIVAVVVSARKQRSARLQRRFGPEYERTARQYGDRARAEQELADREARVRKFRLEELPAGARERYSDEWLQVQQRFVDEPKAALAKADALLTNVMRDRGYPIVNFEQRAADLSPDHATVVQDYRAAHEFSLRSETGDVTTEELRQAMLHYRTLFADLVGNDEVRKQ